MPTFQNFWENLYGGLRSVFFYCVKWFMGVSEGWLGSVVSAIADVLPGDVSAYADDLIPYLNAVNFWVPIDFAILLWASGLTLRLSILSFRHIIKFIPTIG